MAVKWLNVAEVDVTDDALLIRLTTEAKVPVKLTKAVAAAGTGVALAADGTYARALWLTAKKVGGGNVGNVFVGDGDVDKTTDQQTVLEPGDYWEAPIPPGVVVDLNDIYVDAANNDDGVTGGYVPA